LENVKDQFIEVMSRENYTHFEVKAFVFYHSETDNWRIKFLQTILLNERESKIVSNEVKAKNFQFLHKIYDIADFKNFLDQALKRQIDYNGITGIFTSPYPKETFNQSIIFRYSSEGDFGIKSSHYRLIITGVNTKIPSTVVDEMIYHYSRINNISAPQIFTNFFGFIFGPESYNFGFDDFMVFLSPQH
jgi:hypothetical protein